MTFRINANSCKNAMGTVFLLAAAFFVCSTFVSMRSVFADPIAPANTLPQKAGRTSPRANAANRVNTSRTTVSRATSSRVTATPTAASRSTVARGGGATRNVTARGNASVRNVETSASRGVTSRTQAANNARDNRAVRARTATTTSRVSATGSVMPGARASTTTYSYLASSLYTGSYSNIIDSTTGLISADAYSNCMESYYTCMDEICTARSDTKGRCSCAGRATNFLEAEAKLEEANEELIKLSGQLSLLVATKGKGDDLSAAFSLTDAEKVMNCVSWKETVDKYGASSTEAINWCYIHNIFGSDGGKVTSCTQPSYCSSNDFGFDIKDINGSSSDILAQLKAWADAKDLAKQYSSTDNENLVSVWTSVSSVVDSLSGMSSSTTEEASLDKLANKWGYDLFQYAHNNVCGRVLDSCFNGIYEACGTPKSIKEDGTTVRIKCANGATSNCPFNYNSYISVDTESGDVVLSDRSESNNVTVNSSASCFGYSGTSTTTTTRSGITSTTTDPYATLRGPVADARRSIMQKYLLDANAACDVYGTNLKQTAQNINYQKIAAEQALRQKRLEFKQEEETSRIADAKAAIDNFNECISEIWDCYTQYEDDDTWTTARIKSYCSQSSNVPHCYETMICSPLQTQLTAVVDVADNSSCKIYENGAYIYEGSNACRNVVTISEILYGTGADNIVNASYALDNWTGIGSLNNLSSTALREVCLQRALRTEDDAECNSSNRDCLRGWKKPNKNTDD